MGNLCNQSFHFLGLESTFLHVCVCSCICVQTSASICKRWYMVNLMEKVAHARYCGLQIGWSDSEVPHNWRYLRRANGSCPIVLLCRPSRLHERLDSSLSFLRAPGNEDHHSGGV